MRLSRARPHKANPLIAAEGPIHWGEHLRLRRAGGRASEGNPRMNCVADDLIDARWQIEAAPDEHTEMR